MAAGECSPMGGVSAEAAGGRLASAVSAACLAERGGSCARWMDAVCVVLCGLVHGIRRPSLGGWGGRKASRGGRVEGALPG